MIVLLKPRLGSIGVLVLHTRCAERGPISRNETASEPEKTTSRGCHDSTLESEPKHKGEGSCGIHMLSLDCFETVNS
jgi:hypothetical protein